MTVQRHLQENDLLIPQLRDLLVNNINDDKLQFDFVDLSEVVISTFDWYYSPEGDEFWREIHTLIKDIENMCPF